MTKREVVIFKKDNKVVFVDDVYNYEFYSQADTLVVNTKDTHYDFKIKEVGQIIINVILDKVVINSDYILLP